MTGILDPVTLIFFVVALVIFMRLFSVLGGRTGGEPPSYDSFHPNHGNREKDNGNVIPLPGHEQKREPLTASPGGERDNLEIDMKYIARSDSSDISEESRQRQENIVSVLKSVAAAAPSFEISRFIEGAKIAYEMIVTGFANGDRDTLKPLLSREVYSGFDKAIAERENNAQELQFQFIGIGSATIAGASLVDKVAQITVHFSSEVVSALRDRSGEIIDGSETHVSQVEDIWTFERNVTARDPNWLLVATRSPV